MNFVGNYNTSQRVDFEWTSTDSSGVTTAVTGGSYCVRRLDAGTPAAGSLAGLGIVLTTSGGTNHITIFTGSDTTFYAAGFDYHVSVGYGVVGTTTISGYVVGHFSIRNRYSGVDWGSVINPTTTVNLSGTTVGIVSATQSANVTQVNASNISNLISGRIDANTQAMANGVIAAATFAAGAIDSSAIAADAIGSSELAASACNEIADAILLRDVATGSSASTTRSVQAAFRMIVNRSAITGTFNPYTITFYEEDDSTAFQTATMTFSANTFGVSDVNPT